MGASAGDVHATLRSVSYVLALLAVASSPLTAQWSPNNPGGPTLDRAGNCNGDGTLDVADPVYLIAFLFHGGGEPSCPARCDFGQDGNLDLTDIIALFEFLLRGGDSPVSLPEGICTSTINLRFSWSLVTQDVQGGPETVIAYRIYLRSEMFSGVEASPRTLVKQVPPECARVTILDHDLPPIESDTIYIFSVTAVDAAGNESEWSNEVSLTF